MHSLVAARGVFANDHDIDVHDNLTASVVDDTSHGTLKLDADGGLTYTPEANYHGPDRFTYKANDGSEDSNTVEVEITVSDVNDAPVALTDSYRIAEDTTLTVFATPGVLHNDSDADGNPIHAIKMSDPAHGLLSPFNADGSFQYIPESDFSGDDQFTYKASDGTTDESAVTTVHIHVLAVNDAPVALPDAYNVHEDTGLSVNAAKGVLHNDTDKDHNQLSARLATGVSDGTLTLHPDGSFDYTPGLNFNGSDSFTYTANDGAVDSVSVKVTLTVDAINDAPVVVADAYSVAEDTLLTVNPGHGLILNDNDPDGDSLIAFLINDPSNGTISFDLDGSFTYKPDFNFSGTDFFTYKINDGKLDSATAAKVSITVNHVNKSPLGVNDSYTLQEDNTLTVKATATTGLLTNDLDLDHDILNVHDQSPAAHGIVSVGLYGGFTYVPNKNYSGPDSFTYTASDGRSSSSVVKVSLSIKATNDAPIAVDDSYSVGEDGLLDVAPAKGVIANDNDVDGNNLLVSNIKTSVAHGTLQMSRNGGFTYKPAFLYHGPDSFTYTVSDGKDDSNTATVHIRVNHINTPPAPYTDAYSIAQGGILQVTTAKGLLANDLDIDGDTLSVFSIVDTVSHGDLQMVLDGSFTYKPKSSYSGPDSFTYLVSDGTQMVGPVKVNLTVNHVNQSPLASADHYSLAQNSVLTVLPKDGLLANDLDLDGDQLIVLVQKDPEHGALAQNPDGSFTYLPIPNFEGTDTYTYLVSDAMLQSAVVSVTLVVHHSNHVPFAGADVYSTPRNTVLQVAPAQGVLSNDIDLDGDLLTVASIFDTPLKGVLHQDKEGGFKYTPEEDYSGLVAFSYIVTDGQSYSTPATWVTINVNFTNRAPIAGADSYSTPRNTVLQIDAAQGVLNNDIDLDADTLTAGIVTTPQHGTLHLDKDGGLQYTPATDYAGLDAFTYKANDGHLESNVATVIIDVHATNRPPVAHDDAYSIGQGSLLTIDVQNGLLSNDTDADGNQLTVQVQSQPAYGVLHQQLDGSFSYQPANGFNGTDSYTYLASDGHEKSDLATVTITVNAVNQAPLAADDSYAIASDTVLKVDSHHGLLANDADPEGDTLSAMLVGQASNGSLYLQLDGSFTYTPNAGYSGPDTFTYKASDGQLESNVATVTINVHVDNHPPVAFDEGYSVDQNTSLKISPKGLLSNDTDADGNILKVVSDTGPAHGTLHLMTDGGFTYTPATDFVGSDSFTYKASDGKANSNVATVTITVTPNYGLRVHLTGQGRVTGGLSGVKTASSSIDCPVNCEGTYPSGSIAGLFAHLNTDVTQGSWSWSGACPDNQAQCDYTMDADKVANVIFSCSLIELPKASIDALAADWVCYDLKSMAGYEIIARPDGSSRGEVTFRAHNSIMLGSGFRVGAGGIFHAVIVPVTP